MSLHFPAEWHKQSATQLTWPHQDTDWQWILTEVQALYVRLISLILQYQDVIISVPDASEKASLEKTLDALPKRDHQCHIYICPSNDTWARDHGPITVFKNGKSEVLDFQFNGWGNKFESTLDNQITQGLFQQQAYPAQQLHTQAFVLEGGSIESDGIGTLLTTKQCLLNKNRNPNYSQSEIENLLTTSLGIEHILWLEHGDLAGDDTDAHIDTLARLAPNNRIIFQGCQDTKDEHFEDLAKMKQQLSQFKSAQDIGFKLFELPMPDAQYEPNDEGLEQRLPATYANFLFINGAVILPTYNVPQDEQAIKVMETALPGYEIIPFDCSLLIRQYGSLHCITMQIPDHSDPV